MQKAICPLRIAIRSYLHPASTRTSSPQSTNNNQQSRTSTVKLLHPLQNLHIPTRLLDRPQRRLTHPPLPIRSLQLPPRLRLAAPARRHPRQDPAFVRLGEVDEAKGPRRSRGAQIPGRPVRFERAGRLGRFQRAHAFLPAVGFAARAGFGGGVEGWGCGEGEGAGGWSVGVGVGVVGDLSRFGVFVWGC